MDQEYLNLRRQIQINEYEYSKRQNSVLTLCIMFFVLVGCILIGLVTSFGFIPTSVKRYLIGSLLFLFLVYLILNTINNSNRNKFDWDMYNWGTGGNDIDNKFIESTGYNNSSLMCQRHPNL